MNFIYIYIYIYIYRERERERERERSFFCLFYYIRSQIDFFYRLKINFFCFFVKCVRPSVLIFGTARSQDDLTYNLTIILKANKALREDE
jgi:hypothetical protein